MKSKPFFDKYWFRFLVGGFVVATTATLASSGSTVLAAILWSAPITLLPTLLFMLNQGISDDKISTFSYQTVITLINLMVFTGSLSYFLEMKFFKQLKNGALWAIFASLGLWLLGSLLLYYSKIGK